MRFPLLLESVLSVYDGLDWKKQQLNWVSKIGQMTFVFSPLETEGRIAQAWMDCAGLDRLRKLRAHCGTCAKHDGNI